MGIDKDKNIETILGKVYYDPKQGFMGVNNLYKSIKKIYPKIKLHEVQDWLKKQAVSQIHKRVSNKINYMPIFSYNPGSFQVDLTEMPMFVKQNRGYRYILTVININTRKLYAYKSKKKNATDIKKLLDKWIKDVELFHKIDSDRPKPYINRVTTDAGSEFKGNRKWFQDNNIKLTIVNPKNKYWITGKIERVHRTLKELFNKYFTAMNTTKWYDMLDDFIENYNNRYHTSIKMSPNEVGWEEEKVIIWNDIKRLRKVHLNKTPFMLGNYVRIQNRKGVFQKGENLFSDEIYKITKINKLGTYQVSDLDGKELKQTFKDYQLQFIGRELSDIEPLITTTRSNVRKATAEKQAKNRFSRTGLKASDILREGRRIETIMRPKRKKKVKKINWKFKRGDKVKVDGKFFRGTELSNKNRRGRIQQTNSKYQGNIPAYNIKWNTENKGLWYDKESVEEFIELL